MKISSQKIVRYGCAALCVAGLTVAASGAAVPIQAKVAQVLLQSAYERTVATGEAQHPWGDSDVTAIGKISAPRLGVSEIILSATTKEGLRSGPTLMKGSAAIGAPGTSVLAAHRDTHFAFLKDLRVGDVINASGKDGVVMPYKVTSMQVVDADKFTINKGQTQNELALATCYPFGSVRGGTKRYVVRAVLDASSLVDA
jgi:sortase A